MLPWPPPTLAAISADFKWETLLLTPHPDDSPVETAVSNIQTINRHGCRSHDDTCCSLWWGGSWLGRKTIIYTDVSGVGHFTLALLAQHYWNAMRLCEYRSVGAHARTRMHAHACTHARNCFACLLAKPVQSDPMIGPCPR